MTISNKLALLKNANAAMKESLLSCKLCPRSCGVNRANGETGYCRSGGLARIYSYSAHDGEEPPISGDRGSGTVFFSNCTMRCVYCQNFEFSQLDKGEDVSVEKLADIFLSLQGEGCHNINLVNPIHFLPQILAALEIACEKGLCLPIVYNTSGYELAGTLRLLSGIIDIYLADLRYSDNAMSLRYSAAKDYVERSRGAVAEMHRQAGVLKCDGSGIAIRGLIIRLLVLPGDVSGTKETLLFVKDNLSETTYLSVMSQYWPAYEARKSGVLSRRLSEAEYQIVIDELSKLGLNNGWVQGSPRDFEERFRGTNIQRRKI